MKSCPMGSSSRIVYKYQNKRAALNPIFVGYR